MDICCIIIHRISLEDDEIRTIKFFFIFYQKVGHNINKVKKRGIFYLVTGQHLFLEKEMP